MAAIRTDVLEISYEAGGPPGGAPVLLVHGWPDAPRGWREVAGQLHAGGHLRAHHPARRSWAPQA
jgi:pimeloyl-ACP methyl ester carboxylesterase